MNHLKKGPVNKFQKKKKCKEMYKERNAQRNKCTKKETHKETKAQRIKLKEILRL